MGVEEKGLREKQKINYMLYFSQLSTVKLKYLLLIFWPFGAFLVALTDIKSKSSQIIFFIFCLLFGLSFIPKNLSADSYEYYLEFIKNINISFNELRNIYEDYFSFHENQKDIYSMTLVFAISRISHNYHLLFFFYALIFSYFYIKSFQYLIYEKNFRQSLVCVLIAFIFTFSNPIFNINGVRFWTASWIAVYGLFKIIIDGNYKYLILILLVPLIHISFFSLYIVLFLMIVFKKFEKLWIIVFFISFFSGMFLQEWILNHMYILPKVFQNTINSYASDMAIKERTQISEKLASYALILNKLPYYYLNLLVCILIVYRRKLNFPIKQKKLFTSILILFCFVNFTYAIPSMGVRYIALTIPFLFYFWLKMCGDKKFKILIYAIPFVYSYSIFYWIRNMVSVSEPYLYLASFPHLIIKYLTESHL